MPTSNEMDATRQMMGSTPIKVTRQQISYAKDAELEQLETALSRGAQDNAEFLEFDPKEVMSWVQEERNIRSADREKLAAQDMESLTRAVDSIKPAVSTKIAKNPQSTGTGFAMFGSDQEEIDQEMAEEAIVAEGQSKRDSALTEQANDILFDPAIAPSEKVAKTRELLKTKQEVMSAGEAYVSAVYPGLDDSTAPLIADDFDVSLNQEASKLAQVRIVDEDDESTWDQFMDRPREWMKSITELFPAPTEDQVKKYVDGAGEFAKEAAEKGESWLAGYYTEVLSLGVGRGENVNSFRDLGEYLTLIEYADSEQFEDGDLGDAFSHLVDTGELPETFKRKMVSKYGEDWKGRFVAAATFEIGVDGAILAAASVVPGLNVAAFGHKATRLGKAAQILTRAATVATGGAAVQKGIHTALGEQAAYGGLWAQRFAGELAGEVIFAGAKTIGKGMKSILSDGSAKIAKRLGRKVFHPTKADAIRGGYASPGINLQIKAAINRQTERYRKLAGTVANGTLSPEMKALRKNISELTGIEDEMLETRLGLGRKVQNETMAEVLKQPQAKAARRAYKKVAMQSDLVGKKVENLNLRKQNLQSALSNTPSGDSAAREQLVSKIEAVDSEIFDATAELSNINTKLVDAETKMKSLDNLYLTSSDPMTDAIIMEQALGPRILGEAFSRQTRVDDLMYTYMAKDEFSFRVPSDRQQRATNPITRATTGLKSLLRLTEPDAMAIPAITKDYFDFVNLTTSLQGTYKKALKSSLQGLGSKERTQVWDALSQGADAERVFMPTELAERGFTSPQVQDSYYAIRKLLDHTHALYDATLVKELRNKVDSAGRRKVMSHNGEIVNVTYTPKGDLTPAAIKDGYVMVSKTPRSGADTPAKGYLVKRAELEDINNVIDFIPGYLPRSYKDTKYHVTMIDTNSGTIQRVGAFARRSEAEATTKELQKQSQDGVMYVFNTWDAQTGIGSVGFQKDSLKLLDVLDDQAYQNIKKALGDEGLSADQIALFLERLDTSTLRRAHIGSRSDLGLAGKNSSQAYIELQRLNAQKRDIIEAGASADQMRAINDKIRAKTDEFKTLQARDLNDAPDSIREYLSIVAYNHGAGTWRQHHTRTFKDFYVKKGVFNPKASWDDPAGWIAANNRTAVVEGREMQRWMQMVISGKTPGERALDNHMQYLTEKLAKSGRTGRAVSELLDRAPLANTLTSAGRGLVAIPKLGMFSTAQLFVQGSQLAISVGAHPRYATGGMMDLMKAGVAGILRRAGARLPKELDHLNEIITRTGYVGDLSTTDIETALNAPGTHWSGIWEKLHSASFVPLKAGELMNRGVAFFTARREALDLLSKGKLLDINGKPFKGSIDSDEFLRVVTNKAKIMAFNMGTAGKLETISGFGSVLFQFKQVGAKAAHLFETPEMSPAAKFRAGAALVALWGGAGVPFAADAIGFIDWMNGLIEERPSKKERLQNAINGLTKASAQWISDVQPDVLKDMGIDQKDYERLMKKGGISAMTDGEVDLVNRIAFGSFLSSAFEVSSAEDMIPLISVGKEIMDATSKLGTEFIPGSVVNVANLMEAVYLTTKGMSATDAVAMVLSEDYWTNIADGNTSDIEELQYKGMRALQETGQVVPSVGAIARLVQASRPELLDPNFREYSLEQMKTYRSLSNRETGVQVTPLRNQLISLGVTPGALVSEYEAQKAKQKYEEWVQTYRTEKINNMLDTTNDFSRHLTSLNEMAQELEATRTLAYERGVDIDLTMDVHKSVMRQYYSAVERRINARNVRIIE